MGLLSRPEDRASRNEESAIERLNAVERFKAEKKGRELVEIDEAIERARARQIAYEADFLWRDVEIQQAIIDRRLDQRRAIMGLVGPHG